MLEIFFPASKIKENYGVFLGKIVITAFDCSKSVKITRIRCRSKIYFRTKITSGLVY